jgi:hypothetical protein
MKGWVLKNETGKLSLQQKELKSLLYDLLTNMHLICAHYLYQYADTRGLKDAEYNDMLKLIKTNEPFDNISAHPPSAEEVIFWEETVIELLDGVDQYLEHERHGDRKFAKLRVVLPALKSEITILEKYYNDIKAALRSFQIRKAMSENKAVNLDELAKIYNRLSQSVYYNPTKILSSPAMYNRLDANLVRQPARIKTLFEGRVQMADKEYSLSLNRHTFEPILKYSLRVYRSYMPPLLLDMERNHDLLSKESYFAIFDQIAKMLSRISGITYKAESKEGKYIPFIIKAKNILAVPSSPSREIQTWAGIFNFVITNILPYFLHNSTYSENTSEARLLRHGHGLIAETWQRSSPRILDTVNPNVQMLAALIKLNIPPNILYEIAVQQGKDRALAKLMKGSIYRGDDTPIIYPGTEVKKAIGFNAIKVLLLMSEERGSNTRLAKAILEKTIDTNINPFSFASIDIAFNRPYTEYSEEAIKAFVDRFTMFYKVYFN